MLLQKEEARIVVTMFYRNFALTLLLISAMFGSNCGRRGKPVESWVTENSGLKIRATAYSEKGVYLPGEYYVFESSPKGHDSWREVMTFRQDDLGPIPREQVRFVSNQITYIFMGWMYAVTTDAGTHWSVWSAERDLPNWECCNYGLIRDVRITEDGIGVMQLNPIQNRRGEVPELRTDDYGRHWQVK